MEFQFYLTAFATLFVIVDPIALVPMFLGSGGHVRRDLPRLIDALHQRHDGLQVELHTAIGEVDTVLQAMTDAMLALLPAEGLP